MKEFKDWFHELRLKNKMTCQQMADKLGIAKSLENSYENGIRLPSERIVLLISSLFEIDPDHITRMVGLQKIDSLIKEYRLEGRIEVKLW